MQAMSVTFMVLYPLLLRFDGCSSQHWIILLECSFNSKRTRCTHFRHVLPLICKFCIVASSNKHISFTIMFRLSNFLAILSAFYMLGGQLIHRRYKNASTGIILSCYIFSLIFLQCHIPIRLACQYSVSLSPNPLCLSCHETS